MRKYKLAIQPLVQHMKIQISNIASCTTRENTNQQYSLLYNTRKYKFSPQLLARKSKKKNISHIVNTDYCLKNEILKFSLRISHNFS